MPLNGPESMLRNNSSVLIVGLSGRALAHSAHAAMIPATVLDVFCDADTLQCANAAGRVGNVSSGIDFRRMLKLADSLCPPARCTGLVYGAGFESAPGAIADLSKGRVLFGNEPEVLAAINMPEIFFATLARLGVPFPAVRFQYPHEPDGWLAKRAGASGGAHVQAAQHVTGQDGYYFQRKLSGRVMSVLFLANCRNAQVIGVSEQWQAGTGAMPYAYAGAVSQQGVSDALHSDFSQLVSSLTREWKLRGLNSVDLLVSGDEFNVLEVNARPVATAELYDNETRGSLFKQHLSACCGAVLPARPRSERMYAQRVVYAERDLHVPAHFSWPAWCSDKPVTGTTILCGEPICTVHGSGNSLFAVNGFLQRRTCFIQQVFVPACSTPVESELQHTGVT